MPAPFPFVLGERVARPGWVPAEITQDWDDTPYAYQTEEELMPAGGLHGQLLGYLYELMRHVLQARGLMLLIDTFMLYRDVNGVKHRIAPDLLLMPFRFPPPSAYDLDVESAPLCVIEITSPHSHRQDLQDKVTFYGSLGVATYLVIDAITSRSQLRSQFRLHMWRRNGLGVMEEARPDAEGALPLSDMDLRIQVNRQQITLLDNVSGDRLFDMGQLLDALKLERRIREREREGWLKERSETEKKYQENLQEIARLRALLSDKANDEEA